MNRACRVWIAVAFAAAASAHAGTEQLTNSAGDTSVDRIGPPATHVVALRSTGDLAPADPGNADGSSEIYFLDLIGGPIRQVTASDTSSSVARITGEGRFVVSSQGDLTPGVSGNADGSFEAWLYTPRTLARDWL